jgi:hypothetical protein
VTSEPADRRDQPSEADFARAAEERQASFLGEFWRFARHNKKWWLTPIIAILLLVAVLVVLTATGAGPAVYSLF